ncbi:MAG: M14 family zinc carboxypeptidase [Gemmatimonadota bacterium]
MRLSLLLVAFPSLLAAQVPLTVHVAPGAPAYDFYGEGPYRSAVPRPDSLLGHAIGTRHTMYHQQQAVLEAMVKASPDRARMEVTGTTAEGKVMRVVIISSPANISRLAAIRKDLGDLADPRKSDAARATGIIAGTPTVAILSHSIHGNEPAGFEAAMMTAYTLLASESPRITSLLDNVVVIINPSQNPDGHERFAAWNNSVALASSEPAALEQSEPWSIQGRFNHYRFDMNRDLLALSQAETRATAGAVIRWHPQLFVDLHSTTPQFFFPPAASPVNPNVPASSVAWLETFGRGNAAAFDRFGWQYYVRDVFDLFYPGYWDTWPSLQGATGMTFETDGGPELMLRKSDGSVTSFREGIAHHVVASLATLETLAHGRTERLRDYRTFFESAMVPTGAFRQVVIGLGADPRRTREVIDLLRWQGIEVRQANDVVNVASAQSYLGGPAARRSFPAGSYLIDLAQPQGRLARAILEPEAKLDSAFARRQLDRFERNRRRGDNSPREGYEFYDLTAWALPLTQGLDAVWTEAPVTSRSSLVEDREAHDMVSLPRGQSGYLIVPGTRDAQSLALAMLAEGFTLGVSEEGLRADGQDYPAGTIVMRTVRNADSLHARLSAHMRTYPAHVVAVQSAFPDQGQHGIGSESVRTVHAPKVLVAAGDGVSQTAFGDVWWYLEKELGQSFVAVDPSRLGNVRLDEYNVIILPDGRYSGALEASGMNRLRDWVRGGGALIAMGSAVSLLEAKEMGLRTPAGEEVKDTDKEKLTPADTALSASASPAPFVSPSAAGNQSAEYVPGAIARGSLEPGHWLRWGYEGNAIAVPVPGDFLKPTKLGDNVVVFEADAPVLAGFTWPGNTDKFLPGSVWATVDRAGRGTVVAFAENPLYRGFWRGPAMLFANAVLFGAGR